MDASSYRCLTCKTAYSEAVEGRAQAARALGMERTNLHKRMRALGIDRRH